MPKGIPNKKYTGEFKQKVVEDINVSNLSYLEAAKKHGVKNKTQVLRWERIYLQEGPEGLYIEHRGRKTGNETGNKKGRPPMFNKKVEEDLLAEVQRLRAENAYLKKLKALVHEREHLEKKHKQSGN